MKTTRFANRLALSAAALAVAAVSIPCSSAMAAGKPSEAVEAPRILIIDRQALIGASKVGQDMANQLRSYSEAAGRDLKGESEALQREADKLRQQIAILAPDVKAAKIRAFDSKQKAFQDEVAERRAEIQYSGALAERDVENVAAPIVQQIMKERGANLLIDRQAVVFAAPGYDITPLAVQRLNQKMPTIKVKLVKPPPSFVKQSEQQAQQ